MEALFSTGSLTPTYKDTCHACSSAFSSLHSSLQLQISYGDIFKGAPAADAIVSPANSFGFMDGGIDYAYSDHFGWHM